MGAKDKNSFGVVSISRGETQPTHNNQQIMAGKWRDYKVQGKRMADNTVRGKGQTTQVIRSTTTSHLHQFNTQQSNRKEAGDKQHNERRGADDVRQGGKGLTTER